MSQFTSEFVVDIGRGNELFFSCSDSEVDRKVQELCREYCHSNKLFSPRNGESRALKSSRVSVSKLSIVLGKIKKSYWTTVVITLPIEPYNETNYLEDLNDELSELPTEFRDAVGVFAYQEGQSQGYQSVIDKAVEITDWLKPCIVKYTKRIAAKG